MSINTGASPTIPREDLYGAYTLMNTQNVGFKAEEILPPFEVGRVTGTYGVIPAEALLDLINVEVGATSESPESGWSPTNGTFNLTEYRNKEMVTAKQAELYSSWFNAEEIAATRVRLINQRWYEKVVATALINETLFPASGTTGVALSGGSQWDNAAATPITDVQTGLQTIEDNFGVTANTLIMTAYTFRKMLTVTQIAQRLTANFSAPEAPDTGMVPAILQEQRLAFVLGVEKVIVTNRFGSVYNSGKPGQSKTIAKIWDEDYALLTRISGDRDLSSPQLGRTFRLAGHNSLTIDSWLVNDPVGSYIRCTEHKAAITMSTPVGYLIKNTKT